MVADHVLALVNVLLAVETTIAGGAGARVAVDLVLALSLVTAGHAFTIVDINLAVTAPEAGPAETLVARDIVDTDSSVLTGAGLTLVYNKSNSWGFSP